MVQSRYSKYALAGALSGATHIALLTTLALPRASEPAVPASMKIRLKAAVARPVNSGTTSAPTPAIVDDGSAMKNRCPALSPHATAVKPVVHPSPTPPPSELVVASLAPVKAVVERAIEPVETSTREPLSSAPLTPAPTTPVAHVSPPPTAAPPATDVIDYPPISEMPESPVERMHDISVQELPVELLPDDPEPTAALSQSAVAAAMMSAAVLPRSLSVPSTDGASAAVDDDVMTDYRDVVLTALQRHQRYPLRAQRMGIEGDVTIAFRVDADGQVADVAVVDRCPFKVLNTATERLVKKASPLPRPPLGASIMEFTLRYELHH